LLLLFFLFQFGERERERGERYKLANLVSRQGLWRHLTPKLTLFSAAAAETAFPNILKLAAITTLSSSSSSSSRCRTSQIEKRRETDRER
jgi:hypothetical protein